ncbi:DNA methyltransferase [Ectobacillus antri]|uniref:site-specific DNA-methyltransferase (cytosine-N(4)-specific) n=1 Tax=Ectobacillus antri TaxID=2486280 RepID=A0ABT6H6K7_9BACI|nr:DNA methyltransferase [Ectobacillus antri]MDG4657949.1 DNA methyltransferase [Ectobacillus antri]MDG5754967.1 DNA methyltransferase [Ectobacillus antri]
MVAIFTKMEEKNKAKICYSWSYMPKRWGHSLHPMCSYLAMFPPGVPRYFIEQFTEIGDVILDPFSGRGTAPLEACIAGRVGIGVDLNPLAYLLTSAKLSSPTLEKVLLRIEELRKEYVRPSLSDVPEEIEMLYDREITLPQLVYIKNKFKDWKNDISDVDRFILASLMGIMHGKFNKSGTSYLSISMPNTFSMSPNYVKKFIETNGLTKPRVDVFDQIRGKVLKLYKNNRPATKGYAYLDNAKNFSQISNEHIINKNIKMVFTSPPYLKVVNYGTFNWIRLWLLGEDIKLIDKNLKLDDNHSLTGYVDFMATIIQQCEEVLTDSGVACFVIGDVAKPGKEPLKLAEYVWEQVKERTNLNLFGIVEDHLPSKDKVTRIWGKTQGNATKIDRILVLYKGSKPDLKYSLRSKSVLKQYTY